MSFTTPVSSSGVTSDPIDVGTCELLGSLGLFLQGGLALIAFSTLVVKRQRERPRRPFDVWIFDASKQAIGQFLFHTLNVIVSMVLGSSNEESDPCVWYFLNVVLDCSFGVFIMAMLLKLISKFVRQYRWTDYYSGEYGYPPRFALFLKQLGVFLVLVVIVKSIMTLLMLIPLFSIIARAILSPISDNKSAELVIVMVLTPIVMNAVQFWIVDQALKRQDVPVLATRREGVDSDEEEVDGLILEERTSAEA